MIFLAGDTTSTPYSTSTGKMTTIQSASQSEATETFSEEYETTFPKHSTLSDDPGIFSVATEMIVESSAPSSSFISTEGNYLGI